VQEDANNTASTPEAEAMELVPSTSQAEVFYINFDILNSVHYLLIY